MSLPAHLMSPEDRRRSSDAALRPPRLVSRAPMLAERRAHPDPAPQRMTVYDVPSLVGAPAVQLKAFDDAIGGLHDAVAEANHAIYGDPLPTRESAHATAAEGTRGAGGRLPHLDRIQDAFGHHDVRGVEAHSGGAAREAAASLGAHAYTHGNAIAFGQTPDLFLAAHEATHVIQQRAGVALKDGLGRSGDVYERQADAVAHLVVAGQSAAPVLDTIAGAGRGAPAAAIQRQARDEDGPTPEAKDESGDATRGGDATPRANAPADRAMTAEDLLSAIGVGIGKLATNGLEAFGAPDKATDRAGEATDDGLVQQALRAKDKPDDPFLRDREDAVSPLPAGIQRHYKQCESLVKAGKLVFPGHKDDDAARKNKGKPRTGKTSAPFTAFVNAYYAHFGYGERRINWAITDAGGAKALSMLAYLDPLMVAVPASMCGRGQQRLHPKALAAFETMHAAALADGVELAILSGYRRPSGKKSENKQAVSENSSHSYGLAVDLRLSVEGDADKGEKGLKVDEIKARGNRNLLNYYKSDVLKWMVRNGARFGFFPYKREPWHFEYNPEGMAAELVAGWQAFKGSHGGGKTKGRGKRR